MKKRSVLILLAAGVALMGVAYFAVAPAAPRGSFPARFSNAEQRQIESAIQWERYARSVRYLKGGEFREAWRWLQRSRTQRVWDVGDQPDGGIWLHVGTSEAGNSRSITGRFIMRRESGTWKMVASDF